jgi:hypothetical protein
MLNKNIYLGKMYFLKESYKFSPANKTSVSSSPVDLHYKTIVLIRVMKTYESEQNRKYNREIVIWQV